MPFNSEPKYPNRRAYVIKVRSDAKPGALAGRLENLATGRQNEFTSGTELLATLADDITPDADESASSTSNDDVMTSEASAKERPWTRER
jgi:hypothetical protein